MSAAPILPAAEVFLAPLGGSLVASFFKEIRILRPGFSLEPFLAQANLQGPGSIALQSAWGGFTVLLCGCGTLGRTGPPWVPVLPVCARRRFGRVAYRRQHRGQAWHPLQLIRKIHTCSPGTHPPLLCGSPHPFILPLDLVTREPFISKPRLLLHRSNPDASHTQGAAIGPTRHCVRLSY